MKDSHNYKVTTHIYKADGTLSSYGLACGYVQSVDLNCVVISLNKDLGVFHIRTYFKDHYAKNIWDVTHSYKEAYKIYYSRIKEFRDL